MAAHSIEETKMLDTNIRLAALEAVVARLLAAHARLEPDPAGALDQFAAKMRRQAETQALDTQDEFHDRMALAGALLQLVALAKEKLITE